MSLCKSIDTLAMAYLDDELAAEERHELETHLTECATAALTLEQERADLKHDPPCARRPAAPDMLRARLDACARRGGSVEQKDAAPALVQYLLPGSAMRRRCRGDRDVRRRAERAGTPKRPQRRRRTRSSRPSARCRSRSRARAPARGCTQTSRRIEPPQIVERRRQAHRRRACCPAASTATTRR